MKARYVIFILLSLSVAALAACSDAIYATIDTEKKTATNTLSQTISVFDMAVVPTVLVTPPANATYYIAAGAIFQGSLYTASNSVTWDPDTSRDHNFSSVWDNRPFNPPGQICNAMTFFGVTGLLYGGFTDQKTGAPSLYRSSATPYSFGSGATTIALLDAASGEQVTALSAANGNLFVGGAVLSGSNFVYQLEYSTDPGTVGWTSVLTGQPYPVAPVAWDGANYWTASGTTLYSTNTLPAFAANTAQSWGTINSVFASGTTVIVTTKSNGVFYSLNSGVAWTQVQPDHQGTVTVSYLSAAGPVAPGVYLIGSDGYGYYTLTTGSASMSRYGDSTIALYSASISRISLDTANKVVLMGTNARGLWRTVYDSGSGSVPASGQSWINE